MAAESFSFADLNAWVRKLDAAAKVTMICQPANVPRVQALVDEAGAGGIVTVHAHEYVPEGQAYVVRHSLPLTVTFDGWPGVVNAK